MLKGVIYAVAAVLLCAGVSFAEPPMITDEAETLDKGEMQAELTGSFSNDAEYFEGKKAEERESEIEARFIYGIIDNLEVEIEVPYAWVRETETAFEEEEEIVTEENFRAHGYGDVGLEMKWRFYDEDDLSFAVKPALTFPTGNERNELGTGKISYGLMFIASKEFDPIQTEFHLNVGIMHYRYKLIEDRQENRSNIWHVSLAATKKIAHGVLVCGDIGVEENPDRTSSKNPAYFLAGFIFPATKHLDISIGVKVGLTKPEPDFALLPGLVWKF